MDIVNSVALWARNVDLSTLLFILTAIGLLLARNRRWAYWLPVSSFACLFAIATPAATKILPLLLDQTPPLDRAKIDALPKRDAVLVVLTGGKQRAAEYREGETLSVASLERARYAASLAKVTGLPLAVSGGLPGDSRRSEAALVRDFIESELQQKVDIVEGESRNTRDSAQRMSQVLAAQKPIVILVTHSIHMPRAARAFESAGLTVIRVPMGVKYGEPFQFTDFLPTANAFHDSAAILHEVIGIMWYWLLHAVHHEQTTSQSIPVTPSAHASRHSPNCVDSLDALHDNGLSYATERSTRCVASQLCEATTRRVSVQMSSRALQHRGPDDFGIFESVSDRLTLAHTRLSPYRPFCVGEAANALLDGRFVILFNREIYNLSGTTSRLAGARGARFAHRAPPRFCS